MADTITIGGSTYHKLVTFKDCASTGNGGRGMFPWAFMRKKANFSSISSYPYVNGVEEIVADNCIDSQSVLNGPLASKTTYTNKSISSITYNHCLNGTDLIFNPDPNKQIPVKMHGVETGVTNNVYGRLYRDSLGIAEIMYTRSGNDHWVTLDEKIDLPSANGQIIQVQNYKTTNDKAGYHFTFFISDSYDGGDAEYGYYHTENKANGFTLDYMPLTAGNISNYVKFWNICRIAHLDGKYIKVTYKCNS